MNILLRILVILTLVLNGVAFWFTYALYGKRELLKDRNDRFESFTIEIAKTLEGAQPEQTEDDKAALAEMPVIDMESTDAEHAGKALTDLEVRSFWTEGEGGYHIEYESTPEFYQGPDPQDLKEVYVLDAEKKAKLNARGEAVKEGSKMDVALNEIVAKSEAQRDYYTKASRKSPASAPRPSSTATTPSPASKPTRPTSKAKSPTATSRLPPSKRKRASSRATSMPSPKSATPSPMRSKTSRRPSR